MKERFETLKKSEAFKLFIKEVEERTKEWRMILQSSDAIEMLYRAQGALLFADKVINLIDELIDEYSEDETKEDEILGI